jgi:hypothetical protein
MFKYKIGMKVFAKNQLSDDYVIVQVNENYIRIGYWDNQGFGAGWTYSFDEFERLFSIYMPYNKFWRELND